MAAEAMNAERAEAVSAVREAGIVGAGGAAFPTHVKISADVDIVIANGAECEPLLYVDQGIMRRFPERIAAGVKAVMASTGASRGVIALKRRYQTAAKALGPAIAKEGIGIHLLESFYPAGDEFSLVYEVTGRVIPEGGLPLHVGALVQNVHTLIQIADAVEEGRPVTERFVTIAGAVDTPRTMLVPIGTPIGDLIDMCGAPPEPWVVIEGGPMMGRFTTPGGVVSKGTSGIIVLPEEHPYVLKRREAPSVSSSKAASACTVCHECTKYCPRYLLGHRTWPHRAMRAFAGSPDRIPLTGPPLSAANCCECGICTLWACPMDLRPREVMASLRARILKGEAPAPYRGETGEVFPIYGGRKVEVHRMMRRLGLDSFDRPAPLDGELIEPRRVRIPLGRHIGSPAVPVVKKGDIVRKGDIIGEIPEGALGARIHASIKGRVTRVDDHIEIDGGKG